MGTRELSSPEEFWFEEWLKEAKNIGLVSDYSRDVESLVLSEKTTYPVEVKLKTKTKIVEKHLLHPHTYKPDFFVKFTKLLDKFHHKLILSNRRSSDYLLLIDIKGMFTGRRNSSNYTFPLNQKWVYDKYGIYINKIVPVKFFKFFWCPESIRIGKRGKELKTWLDYPRLGDILVKLNLQRDVILKNLEIIEDRIILKGKLLDKKQKE